MSSLPGTISEAFALANINSPSLVLKLQQSGLSVEELLEVSSSQLGLEPKLRPAFFEFASWALRVRCTSSHVSPSVDPSPSSVIALNSLRADMFSPATVRAQRPAIKRYLSLCSECGLRAWPLSERSVELFAASLKAEVPRSANAYLSHVKSRAEAEGHVTSPGVAGLLARLHKAVARNKGPPESEDPFTLCLLENLVLAAAGRRDELLVCKLVIFAFFVIARFDEVRALSRSSEQNGDLTVNIPKSKTDASALGVRIRFCCCCTEGSFAPGVPICPVHVLSHGDFALVAGFPPHKLRSLLSSILGRAGVTVEVPGRKRRLYGFHSSRVGGYQCALASGLDRDVAKKAGRWKSDAAAGYERDAILAGLHERRLRRWPLRGLPD